MQTTSNTSDYAIDAVRKRVNDTLRTWFEAQQTAAQPIGKAYAELWETMLELSQAGGKRIRPYLTMLSYQAFGGKDTGSMMPVAAAQELLHLGLLVHDDIIDRDTTRYGRPNIAGTYAQRFAGQTADSEHYALSSALLAGNLLITGSYQMIIHSELPSDAIATTLKLLNRAVFEVSGGEFLDTIASFSPVDAFDSLQIANYKTASYSFVAPLLIGATAAGANAESIRLLRELGESLGIAYQLSDDLLGSFGDPVITGKSRDGDIRERKRTYLLQKTLQRCTDEQRHYLEQAIAHARPLQDNEIKKVRAIMEHSGAKAEVEQLMQHYAERGQRALDALALEPAITDILTGLIKKVVWRNH